MIIHPKIKGVIWASPEVATVFPKVINTMIDMRVRVLTPWGRVASVREPASPSSMTPGTLWCLPTGLRHRRFHGQGLPRRDDIDVTELEVHKGTDETLIVT